MIKGEIDKLYEELTEDRQIDLEKNEDNIKDILEEEVCSRFYYQKGRIRSFLSHDKEVEKAIAVANDSDYYHKILSSGFTPPKAEEDPDSND